MITIRPAKKSDASRISYLIKKNTELVPDNQYTPQQKQAFIVKNTPKLVEQKIEQFPMFCAFEYDRLVGTIGIIESRVVGMYVSYTQRGKGVGRKLMEYLEEYAMTKGIKKLTLSATPAGRPFYEKVGFQPVVPTIVIFNGVEYYETEMIKVLEK